ncbi:glycoside hydrolase family 47 protein [Xylariaceae sp. FL0016]|nr:glycoside hydrolase family 47 protein [Xylariaceae sp. FL0016]
MTRRRLEIPVATVAFLLILYSFNAWHSGVSLTKTTVFEPGVVQDENYFWRKLPTHFPVEDMKQIPRGRPSALPQVQATFRAESDLDREKRVQRQQVVKTSFARCWKSYYDKALPKDELAPLSGKAKETFGGWGAALVDNLDTLWIMGMHEEFEQAVDAASQITFEMSSLQTINVFETTVRFLGGLLSAYDLSGDQRLLRKAREVGDMLYVAFDTPNRMPITRWDFGRALRGEQQEAPSDAFLAEVGSLCMEFTRLSLLTGDPRWYDATERIREAFEEQQMNTLVPGMWPLTTFPRDRAFDRDNTFGLGVIADSMFEYLPKMHALTGGLIPSYRKMYETAMATVIQYNLWRPMAPGSPDVLISGTVHVNEWNGQRTYELEHQAQHLTCFAGGMLSLGGQLTQKAEHLEAGTKLTEGCLYLYQSMPIGIMPEQVYMAHCESKTDCEWDEYKWKQAVLQKAGEYDWTDMRKADKIIKKKNLSPGFTEIPDARYTLRPEAIESIFVLFRITGRKDLLESAWAMFETIQNHTETKLANAILQDVNVEQHAPKTDSMESFWMSETLKYFYLIFSEPDLISLDEWVFNTKAHPFKRLRR